MFFSNYLEIIYKQILKRVFSYLYAVCLYLLYEGYFYLLPDKLNEEHFYLMAVCICERKALLSVTSSYLLNEKQLYLMPARIYRMKGNSFKKS